jgi:hypothetical protein
VRDELPEAQQVVVTLACRESRFALEQRSTRLAQRRHDATSQGQPGLAGAIDSAELPG